MTTVGKPPAVTRSTVGPEALINAEWRAKLAGLERLWVAQLITPARYAKLRNALLREAAPSWAPGARPRAVFLDRVSLLAAGATGAVLAVGIAVAAWPR